MKFPSSTLRGLLFTAVLAISSRAIDASSVELSSMEISADPVIAELIIDNDDLLGMPQISFNGLAYVRQDVVEKELEEGGSETIWTGADGPFLGIIVKRTDGTISGQFTTVTSTYDLFTDTEGLLLATSNGWSESPLLPPTTTRSAPRDDSIGALSGTLHQRPGAHQGDKDRQLQTGADTVIDVLVVVLNRATCEQGMLHPYFLCHAPPNTPASFVALLEYPCDTSVAANVGPIESKLSLIEAQANMAMQNSNIPVEFRMDRWVHVDPRFDQDTSARMADALAVDANMAFWRSQAGADLVIILTGSSQPSQRSVVAQTSHFLSAMSRNSLSFLSVPRALGLALGAETDKGVVLASRLSTVESPGCPASSPCPILNAYSSPDVRWHDGVLPNLFTMGSSNNNNADAIALQRSSVADLNQAVPNDLCTGAIPLSTKTDEIFTTTGAIEDYREESCDGVDITAPGVWFSTVGTGELITVSTCKVTELESKISVYWGLACDRLFCVAATSGGACPSVSWVSTAGTQYSILVHGVGTSQGNFNIDLFTSAAPPSSAGLTPKPAPTEPARTALAGAPTPSVRVPTTGAAPSRLMATTGIPLPGPPPLCFSGCNTVFERQDGEIPMDMVKVGDYLQTDAGKFSRVFSLAHYDQHIEADFIQIHAGTGSPLEITGDHLVFVNGAATRASNVRIGDRLSDGKIVTSISATKRLGVYAPLTESGYLMVNGIRASSYVAIFDDSGLFWNPHDLGQLLFTPLRLLCSWNLSYCASEHHDEMGYSTLYSWLIQLLVRIGQGGPAVSFIVSAIATPFLLMDWLLVSHTSAIAMTTLAALSGAALLVAGAGPRESRKSA